MVMPIAKAETAKANQNKHIKMMRATVPNVCGISPEEVYSSMF
jgi:hypothetical protein